jgi:hypothetical protein
MNRSFVKLRAATFIGSMVLASATSTRADVFRDVLYGLGYAGFDIVGQRNVLSGGTDFSISRNFIGNELDFGVWDLTMQGPLAFEVQSGGRGLSELEVRLSTAGVGGGTATPLSYLLNVDVGGQEAQIAGQLLLDANVTFNGFGFYELDLNYSSRQNVVRDGRFANDEQEFDFDLGPINVSGNIFADALAIVTQPIFDATGTFNPFASFSGRAKLLDAVADTGDTMVAQIISANAAGNTNQSLVVATSFGVPGLVNASFGPLPPAQGGSNRGQGRANAGVTAAAAAVPEPSVLLLLLLGAPFVIRGGIRFGTSHRRN